MFPLSFLRKATLTEAKQVLNKEEGASIVEYGILGLFIAAGTLAALTLIGVKLRTLFEGLATQLGG